MLGVISFLFPAKINIEKSTIIKASKEVIFEQINNPRNWEKWSPWFKIDTAMDVKYFGNKKGENSGIEWKSEDSRIGCGRLTLLDSKPCDTIYAEVETLNKGKGTIYYLFKKAEGGVKVTFKYEMNLGNNPILRYIGLFIGKRLSKNYVNELDSLKKFTENLPLPYMYKIEEVQSKAFNYIGIREKVSFKEIGLKMESIMNELMVFVKKNNLKMTNVPFSISYSVANDTIDFETAMPVEQCKAVSPKIHIGQMNECNAVVLDYYGPYNKIKKGYNSINNWIFDNKKKITGAPFEMYFTNPLIDKDSTKWLTKIYYPVE